MTPYAVLLVKPTDSDEVVRKTYHVLARASHPDRQMTQLPPAGWYVATAAYTSIKTLQARTTWMDKQRLLSELCNDCDGIGVKGTRMFKGKIKLCATCKGEGRTV